MEATVEQVASMESRLLKIEGPVGSGKTECLVRRACRLVEQGAPPESVLMAVSTAEGARIAAQRLARAFGERGLEGAERVAVRTAQDACLDVLETPAARTFTGRVPRVLTRFEHNFLLEDLKTLGQPVRALRRTVASMVGHWENLDEERSWVLPGTEGDVFALARKLMVAEGGMIAQEAPYLCAAYLSDGEGRGAECRFDHVLADDYQNLSAAQQRCLCLLARETLAIAGSVSQAVACAQAAPNPSGFADFDVLRKNVEVAVLATRFADLAAARMCDALSGRQPAGQRADAPRAVAVKWTTPDDEFNGMTRHLLKLSEDGAMARGCATCVVAPNRQWAAAFEAMLSKRGFSVSSLGFASVGGDPRDMGRARAMVAYTALNLMADPDDCVAWRAWCGYGSHLGRSEGWSSLVSYCDERGIGLVEGLAQTARLKADGAPEPYLRAYTLADRYEEGLRIVGEHGSRRGFDLLRALGALGLAAFASVERSMDGDEDASQLYRLIRGNQFGPVHDGNPRAVHVSSYDQMPGTFYDRVVLAGCVDGFMPRRDAFEVVSTDEERDAVRQADRRSFVDAAGKARLETMFSLFSKADLELAERTRMQVSRVRMEDGRRVAAVRPSLFFSEAASASPVMEGGQALLSRDGMD